MINPRPLTPPDQSVINLPVRPFCAPLRITWNKLLMPILLEDGAIGGTAQKIGGPLAKDGAIGKEFTTEGSIGGTVQDKLGGTANRSN